MTSPRFSALVLAAVCAAPLPALAQTFSTAPQPQGDADRLAAAMRTLGSNPQNLDALVTAAELSLRLNDAAGAASLFARADKVDPRNARVKAGMGALLVHEERPGEALRYFNMAEGYGLPVSRFAAERGLAYDLIGEQERAQRDYRVALGAGANAEVQRRYALSLGIAGRREEALGQLDALVRANDRGAWRARAFVLAMTGDVAGANKIATTMLPGLASGLAPFFERLPRLAATDRAFAVHFGEVRPTPQRLADARLTPPLPVLGPEPGRATMLAAVQSVKVPVRSAAEERRERRAREREARRLRRSGAVQLAQATPAPTPRPQPEPPRYTSAATLPVAALPSAARPATTLAATAVPRVAVPTAAAPSTPPRAIAAVPSTTSAITRRPEPSRTPTSAGLSAFDLARGYSPRPARRIAPAVTPAPVAAPPQQLAAAANPAPTQTTAVVAATPAPQAAAATPPPPRANPVTPTATAAAGPPPSRQVAAASPSIPPTPAAATAPAPARANPVAPSALVAPTPSPPRQLAAASPVATRNVASAPVSPASVVAPGSTPVATAQPSRPSAVAASSPSTSAALPARSTTAQAPLAAPIGGPTPAGTRVTSTAVIAAAPSTTPPAAPIVRTAPAPVVAAAPRAPAATAPVAATTPVAPRQSEESILARIVAGITIPAAELGVTAPAAPAPVTVARAPTPAATPAPRPAAPALAAVAPPARTSTAARPAVAGPSAIPTPSPTPRDRRTAATPAPAPRATSSPSPTPTTRDRRAAERTAAVKPATKPTPKPTSKPKEPAEPPRIWVQVAGGANETDLAKAWRAQQGKAAALKGKAAYSTPLRATNRVVTGPFKTDAEARAFVNTLAKQGVSAFPFTSEQGQKMTKLGADKPR